MGATCDLPEQPREPEPASCECVRLNRREHFVLNRSQRQDGFARDLNPSGQHQLEDVTQAHTETVVGPHAMTDDLHGRR
jgi:hypothetical protein